MRADLEIGENFLLVNTFMYMGTPTYNNLKLVKHRWKCRGSENAVDTFKHMIGS